jgi:hypothetical protein
MARFTFDPQRINYTLSQTGREYNTRLLQRAQPIFTQFLNLLPTNYTSAVQGPNYTNELKAVAVELARLELALEDVDLDRSIDTTRPEFLYSIIGYFLLLNSRLGGLEFDDVEFRNLLTNLIRIYFQGSIPKSMADVVKLFIDGTVQVRENFLLVRSGASGLDISDQFGFQIDVIAPSGGGFPPDMFAADAAIRQILDITRPAHTLFKLRYVFRDSYIPNGETVNKVLDSMKWHLSSYYYDDFRKYCSGLKDIDRLGVKVNKNSEDEDHSMDF